MIEKTKDFFLLFFIQVVVYTIFCINFRAVATANYHQAAVSDFALASLNFFVIKRIAHGHDAMHQWAGYSLGSVVGSYLGIYLSVLIG